MGYNNLITEYNTLLMRDNSIKEIFIFGDEAGSEEGDYLAHGLLCIEKKDLEIFSKKIVFIAQKHNCEKEIHYNELSGDLRSSRFRTAIDWLSIVYKNEFEIYFNYQEIDLKSSNFDNDRFPMKHHIYNLFYKMAFKCLLHRRYKQQKLKINIILHHRSEPLGVAKDPYNQEEYLKKVISLFDLEVVEINYLTMGANHNIEKKQDFARILQLTDLLVSSTFNAIHKNSVKQGKLEVSSFASKIFYQNKELSYSARLNYSSFPNEQNEFETIHSVSINPQFYEAPGSNISLKKFMSQ